MEDKFKVNYDTLNSELPVLEDCRAKNSLIFVLYFTVSCICILIKNVIWRGTLKKLEIQRKASLLR